MMFKVKFSVSGYYTVNVEADTAEEAADMARDEICDVDFGELRDIDSEIFRLSNDLP